MFIDNKYTKWYFNIIKNSKKQSKEGYAETHHIIPKCMGGSNKKDNLVNLSAREHFVVHWLLTKMTNNPETIKKLNYALFSFQGQKTKRKLKSHEYEKIKKEMYSTFNGKLNPMYGKTHNEISKQKMSINRKKKFKEENHFFGKKHTENSLLKMRTKRKEPFCKTMKIISLKRGFSKIFEITNTKTQEKETLFFSEFCRKNNIYQENARKTVYKNGKYKHWRFEEIFDNDPKNLFKYCLPDLVQ